MATKAAPAATPADRSIDPAKVYPLPEFMRLTGFGRWAMRTARRDGLPVVYRGGRAFVRGSDFCEFLSRQ